MKWAERIWNVQGTYVQKLMVCNAAFYDVVNLEHNDDIRGVRFFIRSEVT